ncbi:MAG: type II secretion system protein [Candidatus Parabeggiatoa sp.]|nr:type II secretion system protein [Candidatus Parabeggiatoa sp.]
MNRQAGFTLLEIAIVVVIIGLLLGAVLNGREIILNAKIKQLENDYKGVSAAIYTYQDRYGALPGDDKRATQKFPLFSLPEHIGAVMNGNGNGDINGQFDDASQTPDESKESRHCWAHLRLADLIKGEPGSTELPVQAFNGIIGVSSQTIGRIPITLSDLFVGFTNIPNHAAIILESRLDDNQPHSGRIQTEEFNYKRAFIRHKIYFAL